MLRLNQDTCIKLTLSVGILFDVSLVSNLLTTNQNERNQNNLKVSIRNLSITFCLEPTASDQKSCALTNLTTLLQVKIRIYVAVVEVSPGCTTFQKQPCILTECTYVPL
jgi:hypothetical protein